MSKTVLIVDDAYFMRNLLKKALKEADYEVIGEAKDGKQGIKLYFELRPDIVTMDINMPDISGIEATKQILSKDPTAKIIAVTGNNDDDIKRQILEAGVKEYLQKPFQPAFLWNKLDKVFSEAEEIGHEEIHQEPDDNLVSSQENSSIVPSSVVVQEGVEDDFDDEIEIEIMNKPDESKSRTFVIENEEDSVEFPEEYAEEIEEQRQAFSLTQENLEREEAENTLFEFEDNQSLVEFENLPPTIELEEEPSLIEFEVEEPSPIVNEPIIKEPVVKPVIPRISTPPQSNIKPIGMPKSPQINTSRRHNEVNPNEENLVPTVEIKRDKKNDRKIEEISIRPQRNNYRSNGTEVNIRPPRGKLLREEYDPLDNEEVEEPILNVSDKDNYNNDKNNGLMGMFKKLFNKK